MRPRAPTNSAASRASTWFSRSVSFPPFGTGTSRDAEAAQELGSGVSVAARAQAAVGVQCGGCLRGGDNGVVGGQSPARSSRTWATWTGTCARAKTGSASRKQAGASDSRRARHRRPRTSAAVATTNATEGRSLAMVSRRETDAPWRRPHRPRPAGRRRAAPKGADVTVQVRIIEPSLERAIGIRPSARCSMARGELGQAAYRGLGPDPVSPHAECVVPDGGLL